MLPSKDIEQSVNEIEQLNEIEQQSKKNTEKIEMLTEKIEMLSEKMEQSKKNKTPDEETNKYVIPDSVEQIRKEIKQLVEKNKGHISMIEKWVDEIFKNPKNNTEALEKCLFVIRAKKESEIQDIAIVGVFTAFAALCFSILLYLVNNNDDYPANLINDILKDISSAKSINDIFKNFSQNELWKWLVFLTTIIIFFLIIRATITLYVYASRNIVFTYSYLEQIFSKKYKKIEDEKSKKSSVKSE